MTTISQTLRKRIQDSGLTQVQLAALSGVRQHTISRFLSGATSLRVDNADKLSTALDGLAKSKARRTNKEQAGQEV